jgi:hypothetical protein
MDVSKIFGKIIGQKSIAKVKNMGKRFQYYSKEQKRFPYH